MHKEKKSKYGLLGKDISYSFSEGYFKEKFLREGRSNHEYVNFDLPEIAMFSEIIKGDPDIKGINVTIPYKEAVIPFLNSLDPIAKAIGAVNTIKVTSNGLIGYNTDVVGFKNSLLPLLNSTHKKALILGTGGASKAIAFVLNTLGIAVTYVSRKPGENQLTYSDLSAAVMKENTLIINCSPVGTYPNVNEKPLLPYMHIGENHIAFDLVYNPERSAFLKIAQANKAQIKNGYEMLVGQAEASWDLWNNNQ